MSRLSRSPRPPTTPSPRALGWVVPPEESTATPVGTIDSPHHCTVDERGLVTVRTATGPTWSLDWWIGADDRWHLPTRSAAVRQGLLGGAPVVETAMRIPSGDAVHTAWVARGPRFPGGDEYLVVEVRNDSPVPVALALSVRPFDATGRPGDPAAPLGPLDLVAAEGGTGRDQPCALRAGTAPLLLLSRQPARVAWGDGTHDVDETVLAGLAPVPEPGAGSSGTLPTVALLVPLTHTTTFRVAIPLGAEAGASPSVPRDLPDAERVVAGWQAQVGRGARTEVPDTGLAAGIAASRAHLLLDAGRPPADLVAASRLARALGSEGLIDEAARVLASWPERVAGTRPSAEVAAEALLAAARHYALTRDGALATSLLPELAALARRAGRGPGAAPALAALAVLLEGLGQPRAAAEARAAAAAGAPEATLPAERWAELAVARRGASSAWSWPEGEPGAPGLLLTVRRALLDDAPDGSSLDVLPWGVGPWWGQGLEVHDAPTAAGRFGFAVRWHGDRPALLWDLEAHPGLGPVRVTASVLDPDWSSAEQRGETLLAAVPRPDDDLDAPPVARPVPDELGHAESVAPRSILPVQAASGEDGPDGAAAPPEGGFS